MNFDHIRPEVRWTLASVFLLLLVASLITFVLRKTKPERNFRELTDRVRTWWVIVLMFGITLAVSETAALVFFAFVSFLALKEYLSLIPTRRADRRVLFLAYLAIPFQYYWVHQSYYGMFIVFIPIYMFLLLPTRMVMIGETQGFLRSIGMLHWGLMTTVFSLSHVAFLLFMPQPTDPRLPPAWPSAESAAFPGPGLLVFLVLMTEFNDIAQFVWGKSLGRIKVVPTVSPGKTAAGVIGGVLSTVALAAVLGPRLTLLDWQRATMAGLLIGISGFAGDLSISAMKRDLGVKDSGSTLPGHGGVLDRVDSLTYTAPLFFHFIYFYYM